MVNAGDVSMAWNQCVYATPGFPYSVYIASDQTTTKSSSSSSSSSVPPPRFLAQLNIKRTKPPKTSRFKKAPASIRLEFRTEDEDEMDVVVLSTVLMVAGKFEWEKLAVIMVEGEVGATAAEAGSVLDWTAPPPLAIHRSHDSSRAGSHHDLPPAYA